MFRIEPLLEVSEALDMLCKEGRRRSLIQIEHGPIAGIEILQAKTVWILNFKAFDEFRLFHGEPFGVFGTWRLCYELWR